MKPETFLQGFIAFIGIAVLLMIVWMIQKSHKEDHFRIQSPRIQYEYRGDNRYYEERGSHGRVGPIEWDSRNDPYYRRDQYNRRYR